MSSNQWKPASFTPINKAIGRPESDTNNGPLEISNPQQVKRARTLPNPENTIDSSKTIEATGHGPNRYGRHYAADMSTKSERCEDVKKSSSNDSMPVSKHSGVSYWGLRDTKLSTSPKARPLDPWLSTNIISRLDSLDRRFTGPTEQRTSLVSPDTSVHALKSSPGIGCSIYSTKFHVPNQKNSRFRGHPVTRVVSRPLQPDKYQDPSQARRRAPSHRVALVTDLDGINASLDANDPTRINCDDLVADFSDRDLDGLGDLLDEDLEEFNFECHPESIDKPNTSKQLATEGTVDLTGPTNDQRVNNIFDDDMFDVDKWSDISDDFFTIDEHDAAELELITRSIEDQIRTESHEAASVRRAGADLNESLLGTPSEPISIEESTEMLPSTGGTTPSSPNTILKPIVRSAFPGKVKDRSPVVGLTANSVLRTCFRVGEALNSGCNAVRQGRHVVIELYARVTSSWRQEGTALQFFVFADLYHDNPPFLNGVHETWKKVSEWEEETTYFLRQDNLDHGGRMCRVIGSMRRKDGAKWELVVQSIHKAGWEDVKYVAGIYA